MASTLPVQVPQVITRQVLRKLDIGNNYVLRRSILGTYHGHQLLPIRLFLGRRKKEELSYGRRNDLNEEFLRM